MKSNLLKIVSTLGLCLLLGGLVFCTAAPQEPQQPQEQQSAVMQNEAQGKLVEVDVDAQTLAIEQEDGTRLTFHFDESTEVMGAEGVQGLANNQGTWVKIQYHVEDSENYATSIEIRAPESF